MRYWSCHIIQNAFELLAVKADLFLACFKTFGIKFLNERALKLANGPNFIQQSTKLVRKWTLSKKTAP